jgi:ribose transport system ATP-binding protein
MSTEPFLAARGVQKRYGAIVALAHADIEIRGGEVMGLLGPNGAGKSTLTKILSGRLRPDGGQVTLMGKPAGVHDLARPGSGIVMMEQELSIVPTMSVGQNVFLGNPALGRWSGPRQAARRAAPFLDMAGVGHLDSMVAAGRLSVGEQQLVELARALARDAQILILDEPTAALSDPEIQRVLEVVGGLRGQGRAIVYISHRLDEVMELVDRVTVVRDGRTEPAMPRAGLKLESLITQMLGRPLETMYPAKAAADAKHEVLRLDGVLARGLDAPVSLSLKAGQIVGLAGQLGSGAPALLEAIAGVRPLLAGALLLADAPAKFRGPRQATAAGIAYCSGDRKRDGLFAVRSVQENLSALSLRTCSRAGWVVPRQEMRLAEDLAARFGVDAGRMRFPVSSLSGGNQQKVALGKWLGIRPRVLLVNEPTRGVDVGARADIYRYIRALADEGLAVMFASSDGDEVLGLADSVVSFYRGTVVRAEPATDVDLATLTHDLSAPPARQPKEGSLS